MIIEIMHKLEEATGTKVGVSPDGKRLTFQKNGEHFMVRVPFDADKIEDEGFVEDMVAKYHLGYDSRPDFLKTPTPQMDKEYVLENVVPCFLNENTIRRHEASDIRVYTRKFCDVLVGYRVKADPTWESSFLLSVEGMEKMDITPEELHDAAKRNIYEHADVGLVEDITGHNSPECGMVVVTTKERLFGASLILDTRIMDKICALLDADDVQVIPSSIHEVLVIPWDSRLPDEVIMLTNKTNVHPRDQFSDHGYRYMDDSFAWKEVI